MEGADGDRKFVFRERIVCGDGGREEGVAFKAVGVEGEREGGKDATVIRIDPSEICFHGMWKVLS